MEIQEYLNNDKITSNANLSEDSWNKLFSELSLKEKIEENNYTKINIQRIMIYDSNIRTPESKNIFHYFYNGYTQRDHYYALTLSRNLTFLERKSYGPLAVDIQHQIVLPKNLWFTANRVLVQNRPKRKCKHCGEYV